MAAILAALLAGCAALPSPRQRTDLAMQQLAQGRWQAARIAAGRFELLAAHPAAPAAGADEWQVFIEGDGLAWIDPRTPSDDPTPRDPLALRLALAERHRPSAWLARPCQYTAGATAAAAGRCAAQDWTDGRFSPEIIAAMDDALDQLKQRLGARRLALVGYSGGGTLAALLAARRTDITRLVTVAAVLDTAAWTRAQGLSPLAGSLNPADAWRALRGLPQVHFVGGADRRAGRAAVQPFVDRWAADGAPRGIEPAVVEEAAFGHACCWVQAWERLAPP